jgi:hypothetical protein
MEALLVGEAFHISLDDGASTLPEERAQLMESGGALLGIGSRQVLEGVDRFDVAQVILEPLDAAFGLAILDFLEELRDFFLAKRALGDGIALDQGDFDIVVRGEQKGFPFLRIALFDGQLAIGVLGAEEVCQIFEGRELLLLGQNSGVITHIFLLPGRQWP